MDPMIFIILIFLTFVSLMMFLSSQVKKLSVYITAFTATVSAWFVGMVLDANIHFGDPEGFLSLRILLSILAMGFCILHELTKNKSDA